MQIPFSVATICVNITHHSKSFVYWRLTAASCGLQYQLLQPVLEYVSEFGTYQPGPLLFRVSCPGAHRCTNLSSLQFSSILNGWRLFVRIYLSFQRVGRRDTNLQATTKAAVV